jgi:hypothetical protein
MGSNNRSDLINLIALIILLLALAIIMISKEVSGAEEYDVLKLHHTIGNSVYDDYFDMGCYEIELCDDHKTTRCDGYTRMYWVENLAQHTNFPWHYIEHMAMRDWGGGLRLETREHRYNTTYVIKMVTITVMVDEDLDGDLDTFSRWTRHELIDDYAMLIINLPEEYPPLTISVLSKDEKRAMFSREVKYWMRLHGHGHRILDYHTTQMVKCLEDCRLNKGWDGEKCMDRCGTEWNDDEWWYQGTGWED